MYEALLLDIGFVIIDVTWAVVDAYEKATGTGPPGREPGEREGDAPWRAYLAGAITAARYWGEVASSRGFDGMPGEPGEEVLTLVEHDGVTTLTAYSKFNSIEERDGAVASGMETGAAETYDRLEEMLPTIA